MIRTLLRILITSAGLALWEIVLKDLYIAWLRASDKVYGFGEAMLGYFIILCSSYFLSYLVTHQMAPEGGD